jgi:hypothetical protein
VCLHQVVLQWPAQVLFDQVLSQCLAHRAEAFGLQGDQCRAQVALSLKAAEDFEVVRGAPSEAVAVAVFEAVAAVLGMDVAANPDCC